jgi:hypothetical protein
MAERGIIDEAQSYLSKKKKKLMKLNPLEKYLPLYEFLRWGQLGFSKKKFQE